MSFWTRWKRRPAVLSKEEEAEYAELGQLLLAVCHSREGLLPEPHQSRSEALFVKLVEQGKARGESLDDFLCRFPPTVAERLNAVIEANGGKAPTK
jgi:hypothetical protein